MDEKHAKRPKEETFDEGVDIEILSRLPVKSISSFKTVCKNWRSLMSDKYFAKKQLAQSRKNPSFISFPCMDARMKSYLMRPGSFEPIALNTINPAGRSQYGSMNMISSFNGLICCTGQISVENRLINMQIWICNPCTGETLLLPQGRPSYEVEPIVVVAYESDVSDYKVFRIFCTALDLNLGNKLICECEVYSSSTGSWENIGPVPPIMMYACFCPFRLTNVCVGGKIFWLVPKYKQDEILSVDMEGRFEVINLPGDIISGDNYLVVLQGSLSVVIQHGYHMDVWVWKKEGWVFVCEDNMPFEEDKVFVLGMTSIKNQILCITDAEWWTYDVDSRIWNKDKEPPYEFCNSAIFPFTESLLPCNGGVMLETGDQE